jgi:integrase/recombinase XerD
VTQAIENLINQYVEALQKDNDTIKAYRLDLEKFTQAFGSKKASELSKEEIAKYLEDLTTRMNKRVSVSTQNRHYATLSCFFNWLIKNGVITDNPMKFIPRRKPNKDRGEVNSKDIIRYLDKDTVRKILDNAKSVREEFLFDLLYSSGLRISEALTLNVQDIRNGIIHIRQGKGNKPRVTYLSKQSEKLFKRYLEKRVPERLNPGELVPSNYNPKEEGALFTTNNGTRLGYHRANQLFKQAAKGIRNSDGSMLTIHQLRHTFCTERVGSIDIRVLQKLAGHSDIRTTLRYAKVTDKVAKKQFYKFDQDRSQEENDDDISASREDFDRAEANI